MTDQKRALYERAIRTYGAQAQIFKAVEELGELASAVGRYEAASINGEGERLPGLLKNVAEEIADVRITLEQLCMIYEIEIEAGGWEWSKLARLKARLDSFERAGEGSEDP